MPGAAQWFTAGFARQETKGEAGAERSDIITTVSPRFHWTFAPALRHALPAGILASALVVGVTSGAGPGLDPDSLAYSGAATSVVRHGSLRVPSAAWWDPDSTSALTRWPPGFPVAIAAPELLGASQRTASRLVLAVSALVAVTILFLLLEAAAGVAAGWIGVAVILATPAILGVYLSVLSEPLFLACISITLFVMVRRSDPFVAGAAAGAAMMVRYAGACAPAAVFLWYLLERDAPMRQRLQNAVKSAALPALLLLLWVARVRHLAPDHSGIEFRFYGDFGPTATGAIQTIAGWLAPLPAGGSGRYRLFGALLPAGLIATVSVFVLSDPELAGGDRDSTGRRLLRADLTLLGCYLGVLLLARMFVGGTIPFDFRLLAPAIVLLEIALILLFSVFFRIATGAFRFCAAALLVVWLAAAVSADVPVVSDAITDGLDFAGSDWRLSDTIDWVRTNGNGRTLFSNWPPPIYFHAYRIARDLPDSLDCRDLAEFRDIMRKSRGALVAFTAPSPDYPPPDSLARMMGLVAEKRLSDGTIWTVDKTRAIPCP